MTLSSGQAHLGSDAFFVATHQSVCDAGAWQQILVVINSACFLLLLVWRQDLRNDIYIYMNWISLALLATGGVVLTVGDVVMKKWVNVRGAHWYVFGLAIYFVGLNFLAHSFKYENIAVASVVFVIFNVVTLSLVSWLYFKETPTTMQLVGMAVGIVSIVILELGAH